MVNRIEEGLSFRICGMGFILAMAMFSCHKHVNKPIAATSTVYVAGYLGTPGLTTTGVYWKNGAAVSVPNSSGISSMYVNDTDVYLLDGATYWKNGVPQTIPDANFTKSIAVLNGDVYVVGSTVASSAAGYNTTAAGIFFKNGAQVDLTQNVQNIVASFTNQIAFSGSDVYLCGYLYAGYNDSNDAVYWKNSTMTTLANGYMAKAIAVSGGTVYVGGTSIHDGDVYWVNGAMQTLGPDPAIVNCIVVSGSDVYVGGTTYGQNKAAYWKNGVEVLLQGGYTVNAMAVVGSDVYAAGNDNAGDAVYWKNGVADTLGIGGASSIVVK
jgi:hypothetical protein